MMLLRFRRPAYAWIAGLAMLLGAFAPVFAHRLDPLARAAAGSGRCTAGDRSTDTTSMVGPAAPHRGHAQGDGACPFCVFDSGTPSLPARGPGFLAVGSATAAPDVAATGEWIAAPGWPAAQSRAPPR